MKPQTFEHEFTFDGKPYFCIGTYEKEEAEYCFLEGGPHKAFSRAINASVERVFDENDYEVTITPLLSQEATESFLNYTDLFE